MKKNQLLKTFAIWFTVSVLPLSIALSQNSQSQLAQKIMLENHLRTRAESALKHALGKVRFFVNVNAEINIIPAQRSQQIWEPGKEAKDTNISRSGLSPENLPAGVLPSDLLLPPTQSFSPVLPGFPEIQSAESETPEVESPARPLETIPEEPSNTIADMPKDEAGSTLVSYSIERTVMAIPEIVKLDVTVMFEDGVDKKVLDAVRPIVEVATGLDYQRGDKLNIVTTSFLQGEAIAQLTAEGALSDTDFATIEESLAARMLELEAKQNDAENRILYYLGGGLLFLLLLAFLIIRYIRRNNTELADTGYNFENVVSGTPAEISSAQADAKLARESDSNRMRATALEREMHKAELKNTRQAIITLSIGKPDTATKILNDWISSTSESTEEI
ncbi:MAG: hypothetical protein IIB39_08030 [Candidatus Marinimicrobia bacterium]|nr:hypothetical protein [Candidatus Neomarinimicrobiota bacterium]